MSLENHSLSAPICLEKLPPEIIQLIVNYLDLKSIKIMKKAAPHIQIGDNHFFKRNMTSNLEHRKIIVFDEKVLKLVEDQVITRSDVCEADLIILPEKLQPENWSFLQTVANLPVIDMKNKSLDLFMWTTYGQVMAIVQLIIKLGNLKRITIRIDSENGELECSTLLSALYIRIKQYCADNNLQHIRLPVSLQVLASFPKDPLDSVSYCQQNKKVRDLKVKLLNSYFSQVTLTVTAKEPWERKFRHQPCREPAIYISHEVRSIVLDSGTVSCPEQALLFTMQELIEELSPELSESNREYLIQRICGPSYLTSK